MAPAEAWKEKARALLRSPLPLFLALALYLLVVHEPWRDEAQPWLIVRDAPHLFYEMDSEGTPALWYALFMPLVKLGLPFASMRVLHVLLAAAALSVFLLHAPFSRGEKWLFSFGYFVAYEYLAIARSYVVVLLLLFLLAAFHRERHERPFRHALLLGLLANATAHGTLLALVFAGAWGLEGLFRRPLPWRTGVATGLVLAAAALAVLQVLPRDDVALWRTHANTEWAFPHLVEAARGVLHAFIPYPHTEWSWGLTYLDARLEDPWLVGVGAAVYLASCAAFLHRPRVLALYVASTLVVLTVVYLKHGVSGQMRHHGLLFVLFVFCLWLARVEPGRAVALPWRRLGTVALVLLLVGHVAATPTAVQADARATFSGGPDGAAFLKENGYLGDGTLLAVYPAFIAASVLVHVEDEHRMAYFPQVDAYGSYVRWTHEDAAGFGLGMEAIVARAEAQAAREGAERIVLLLSFPMSAPWFDERYALVKSVGSLSPGDGVFAYIRTCPCGTQAAAS